MEQVDFPRFRAVMAGMAKVYEREIDGPLLDAYWLALRDWSLADFEAAAGHLMATSEFMPRPAAFSALRKAARPSPVEAWDLARRSLQWTVNGYVEAPGIDPLVAKALRSIGGANALAMCDEDKLHFLERRFVQVYESLQDSNDTRQALPQIAGPAARPRLPGLRPLLEPVE